MAFVVVFSTTKRNQVNRQSGSAFYILTVPSRIAILSCQLLLPNGIFICFICLGDVNDSIESEGSKLLEKEELKVCIHNFLYFRKLVVS